MIGNGNQSRLLLPDCTAASDFEEGDARMVFIGSRSAIRSSAHYENVDGE